MAEKKRKIFVVGFPHSLAVKVLETIGSSSGVSLLLLCDSQDAAQAKKIESRLSCEMEVVKGTPKKIDFGLSGEEYLDLADRVTDILCLPRLFWNPRIDDVSVISNIAKEVVELGQVAPNLNQITVLSHVDVAGDFTGSFGEKDLLLNQKFSAEDAACRFRAERIYRTVARDLPVTVIRAGDILGPYEDLCPIVHMLIASSDSIQKNADQVLPIVDFDDAANIISKLVMNDSYKGFRTLHLISSGMVLVHEIVGAVKRVASSFTPGGFEISEGALRALGDKLKDNHFQPREYLSRRTSKRVTESAWTRSLLESLQIELPEMTEEKIEKIVKQAIEEIVGLR